MSDLIIKGMEMPKDHPLWIVVHPDGTVEANEVSPPRPVVWQTLLNAAVPVPLHGRLIDADAFDERVRIAGGLADEELSDDFKDGMQTTLLLLKTQATIIPKSV